MILLPISTCPAHAVDSVDHSYKGNIDVMVYDIFANWPTGKRLLNNIEGGLCILDFC